MEEVSCLTPSERDRRRQCEINDSIIKRCVKLGKRIERKKTTTTKERTDSENRSKSINRIGKCLRKSIIGKN